MKTGSTHTKSTKLLISLRKRQNPTRYWLGKKMGPMPQWWRDKVSKALKGKNTWNSTRIVSAETRRRMSVAQKSIGNKPPIRYGKDNNMWRGGKMQFYSALEQIRKSPEYTQWRDDIFFRDDFTCQICGERGVSLRANHIKRFIDYPDLRLEPTNGISICRQCDLKWVLNREQQWESYFNFNLMTRNIMSSIDEMIESERII